MIDTSVLAPLIESGSSRRIATGTIAGTATELASLGGPTDGAFAIGSLSKVFTSLLLADAAVRNEAQLHDRVARWLPEVTPRDPSLMEITLADLASHSAGLPREAPNLIARLDRGELDLANPFAGYLEADLLDAWRDVRREMNQNFEYSNFGFMVLALVLQRLTDQNFRDLVALRICEPLGLHRTFVRSSEDLVPLEQGHNRDGVPVPFWDEPLPGPGGIYSTAEDLCRFLSAACNDDGPLGEAFGLMEQPRVELRPTAPGSSTHIGLGWFIAKTPTGVWLWHGGSAGGVHGFIAINCAERRGLVGLANWFEESRPLFTVASALLGLPH